MTQALLHRWSSRHTLLFLLSALAAAVAIVLGGNREASSTMVAADFANTAAVPYVETRVTSSDTNTGDNFGYAVSLSENTLVIGAQWAAAKGQQKAGAVYVFTRPSADSTQWTQVTRLTASDAAEFDQFGAAVDIDGDTIVVGATGADVDGHSSQGAAYVFERNKGGTNKWGQVKKLIDNSGNNFESFGDSLAVQDDEVFVGAKDADVGGASKAGAVFVYGRNEGGADNWGEAQELTDPLGRQSDSFGSAVGVDGTWLAVGAERADVTGTFENDGAVFLFKKDSQSGDWTYVTRLTASDADGSERFGASVAIQGERVLTGAPAAERNGLFSVGKAYLFARDQGGADKWGEVKILTAGDGGQFDNFGLSVALSSDTAYAGANAADVTLVNEGAVYSYGQNQGGANNWGEDQKLAASDGKPNDNFASVLVSDGETIVIGGYLADKGRGKAYVFTPGAPPRPSSAFLAMVVDQAFIQTGMLVDGGVVEGPDGVRLGAVPGALNSDLGVSIVKSNAPGEALPSRITPRGDYYTIAATREVVRPLDTPFILALPVPPGVDTKHLAAAVYATMDGTLDFGDSPDRYWLTVLGAYDKENKLLLVPFPYVSTVGETVTLVEHPDISTPETGRLSAAGGRIGQASGNFIAACSHSCAPKLVEAVEDHMQIQFAEFLNTHKYLKPRLQGDSSDMSIDPPAINQGQNFFYYVFVHPAGQKPCVTDKGKEKLGFYRLKNASLNLCFEEDAKSLSDSKKDTIRHEYFHALQYAYPAMLDSAKDTSGKNLWIVEGTAEAAVKSGEGALDWHRVEEIGDIIRKIRQVDLSLLEGNGTAEYEAQDFWVFAGRQYLSSGLKKLVPIFADGATYDSVVDNMSFGDAYWDWAKNQVVEKTNNLDGALGDRCKLEEEAVLLLDEWDIPLPATEDGHFGGTGPLKSNVVELKFTDDWSGRPVDIRVELIPGNAPQPEWFNWKVYRTPSPDCTGGPENAPLMFKFVPGERVFVVLSNWSEDEQQLWKIVFE